MGDKTGIEWTDATWNPLVGCAHVSEGCDGCYAADLAAGRLAGNPTYSGLAIRGTDGRARFTGEVRTLPDRLDQPLRWTRPRRVFVNSMSDLFAAGVPRSFVDDVFDTMVEAGHHTYQLLTKRPQALVEYLLGYKPTRDELDAVGPRGLPLRAGGWLERRGLPEVPAHVWLGTSIELDKWAWRARWLRAIPAAVRWVSAEPLLGPLPSLELEGLRWVVIGGESGRHARPMDPRWVAGIVDAAYDTVTAAPDGLHSVAVLLKQWGEWAPELYVGQWPAKAERHVFPPEVGGGLFDIPGPTVARVGKKAAGRLFGLEGRLLDEYPDEVPALEVSRG